MPITTKTAAALFGLLLALICGAWIILDQAIRPGFERLEVESVIRDRARLEARLQSIAREMETRALDYAQWDDTYAFISGTYPEYVADNFSDSWYSSYDLDVAVIGDHAGRVLWAGANPDAAGAETVAEALLTDARAAIARSDGPYGVFWTEAGPLLYAATPSVHTDLSGPTLGLVVFARRLSAADLAQEIQLSIALINARQPNAYAARIEALTPGSAETWMDDDVAHSLLPLHNGHGAIVGAVLAERPLDITALGAKSIGIALALFALVLTITIAALWVLLRRLVITRLIRLQQHFHAQLSTTSLAPHDDEGNDEIGRLTDAYNALVTRLQDANERELNAVAEREAASKANQMKSDFLANISHELRTPLNAVIGYAELVKEDLTDSGIKTGVDDLDRIRASGRHLLSLINEILDLAKVEAGRLEITPASFRVACMLASVADTIRPLAKQQQNNLILDIADDLGNAYSDEMRLRQSLINVLSNACKFTTAGDIRLRAQRFTLNGVDTLRFEVSDTGIGMTPEQVSKVFEPFVQADSSISRRFGGTGLGLAITRKIMTLLGGRIDAHSASGEGTTFVLTCPVVAIEAVNENGRTGGELEAA